MDKYLKEHFNNLTLEWIKNTQFADTLQSAVHTIEKLQQNLHTLSEKQGSSSIINVKIGTVLTFAILNKISQKKSLLQLTKDDWKEIAESISKYAILMDDMEYSVFVFEAYEQYIRSSVNQISQIASPEKVSAIITLADELYCKTEAFREGDITEVIYIEECLWISLEAMIKLLASMTYIFKNEEIAELALAISGYAFEYGRYMLYKREQELVSELIESQYQVDQELSNKFELFKVDLEEQSKQFYVLIDNAFSSNFRETFLKSIALANTVGVESSEILKTVEDVDSFFID